MDSSNVMLDYGKLINDIQTYILSNTGYHIISIEGPSGSGKTWLTQESLLRLGNDETSIIYLQGDESRKTEEYYPLSLFIEKRKNIKKTGKAVFYSVLDEVPFVGKPLKALIQSIDSTELINQKAVGDIPELKHHLSFSLRLINLLRKYETVIIVCESANYFDEKTLLYLLSLEAPLKELFPKYKLIILLDDPGSFIKQYIFKIDFRKLLKISLRLAIREEIPQVVSLFDKANNFSEEIYDLIFSCTAGDLGLIKIIVSYLSKGDFSVTAESDTLTEIIDSRIESATIQSHDVAPILNSIAILGNRLPISEILCVSNNNPKLLDLLDIAKGLEFISINENYVCFKHDIIWKAFEFRGLRTKHETLNKLSNCLKKISPSNYARRALIEIKNGNFEEADTLWCLIAIEKFRDGLFEEATETINNLSSLIKERFRQLLMHFKEAFILSLEGKVQEALLVIEAISDAMPFPLQAQKCLLRCENLSKLVDIPSKQNMLSYLNDWTILKDEEPVLWYRVMQLKILAASELGLEDIAKTTEFEIISFYSKRLSYDKMAEIIINRLNLYAELIYSPEVSHKKLKQAEQYFSEALEEEQFERAIDLYIARVNLSSNSLLLCLYEDAVKNALFALELVKQLPNVRFPNIDSALSNLYLASYFGGVVEIENAVQLYQDLLINFENEEDYILLRLNLAGLLLRAGKINEAYTCIIDINQDISPSQTDPYYHYYYSFNKGLLMYLMGMKKESLEIFHSLKNCISKVNIKSVAYYQKHYDLTLELLQNGESLSYVDIERKFTLKQSEFLSFRWNKFKYIYLFTDLQIWSSF